MSKIIELREKLNSEDDIKNLFNETIEKAKECNNKYNAFVTITDEYNHIDSDSFLNGIPYSLKDNFSTEGILTTGSSNLLKNYVPVFDSTVYEKLKNAGAVLIGKTVLDELAMGGTGTTGNTGIVKNPCDINRMIGGSSSGSAASVAAGVVPFSIGSDTGDSVRKPASYSGIVGFKPTYGRISRYGLFNFASSLDHVGILSKSVMDAAIVTDILKGYDSKDMTSLKDDGIKYVNEINNDITGKKLFYIKEIIDVNTDSEEVKENIRLFHELIDKIKSIGVFVEEVSFDKSLLNAIQGSYYSISCAEATSNNSNLTGLPFGERVEGKDYKEIMLRTRTDGFSELIKRRFVLGSYILKRENQEKLYLNALRVRRLIVEKMNELFNKYDGLILPSTGGIAPLFNSNSSDKLSNEYLLLESHMIIGNFGGYPSISIPYAKVNSMPVGITLTCGAMKDALTLNIANKLEELIKYDGGEYHV